jgi:hypothetical protein
MRGQYSRPVSALRSLRLSERELRCDVDFCVSRQSAVGGARAIVAVRHTSGLTDLKKSNSNPQSFSSMPLLVLDRVRWVRHRVRQGEMWRDALAAAGLEGYFGGLELVI